MHEATEFRSDRVLALLTELSVDPFKCDSLLRDPAAFMADAGLSPSEQAVLTRSLRGDSRAVSRGSPKAALFFDPGDDPEPNPDPPPEGPAEPAS